MKDKFLIYRAAREIITSTLDFMIYKISKIDSVNCFSSESLRMLIIETVDELLMVEDNEE